MVNCYCSDLRVLISYFSSEVSIFMISVKCLWLSQGSRCSDLVSFGLEDPTDLGTISCCTRESVGWAVLPEEGLRHEYGLALEVCAGRRRLSRLGS